MAFTMLDVPANVVVKLTLAVSTGLQTPMPQEVKIDVVLELKWCLQKLLARTFHSLLPE